MVVKVKEGKREEENRTDPGRSPTLLIDCYFMTLITHLSKPEPTLEAALKELEGKYRTILNIG